MTEQSRVEYDLIPTNGHRFKKSAYFEWVHIFPNEIENLGFEKFIRSEKLAKIFVTFCRFFSTKVNY